MGIQLSQSCLRTGPLEPPIGQTFVKQDISIAGPVQRLDPVRPTAAEQEQAFFIQMTTVLLRDDGCQSRDTVPEIVIATGHVIDNVIFLSLSKFAYTKFYERPTDKRVVIHRLRW